MIFPRIRPIAPFQLPPEEGDQSPKFLLRDPAGLASGEMMVSLPTLYITELADGTRDLDAIAEEMIRLTGLRVEKSQMERLFEQLDSIFLLDNERARQRLEEISPRPARHAGSGYPDEAEELTLFLDDLLGPEPEAPNGLPRASLLPHIDFYRGRDSYRAGYQHLRSLSHSTDPITVVILGISHAYSRIPFILTRKDFDTPLGVVETDHQLVDALASDLPFDPFQDEYNHLGEHSVEFHAVLLKHLTGTQRPLKIVPVLCRSFAEAISGKYSPLELPGVEQFLNNLAKLRDERTDIHFLASVDLAHMGVNFGGEPLTNSFLEELAERDKKSLAGVQAGKPDEFFATHQADGGERNYCGTPAIYSLLHLFPKDFTLHSYQQCTEPDLGSTVTICSASLSE